MGLEKKSRKRERARPVRAHFRQLAFFSKKFPRLSKRTSRCAMRNGLFQLSMVLSNRLMNPLVVDVSGATVPPLRGEGKRKERGWDAAG